MKKWMSFVASLTLFIALPLTVIAAPLDEVKSYVNTYYVGDVPTGFNNLSSIEEIEGVLDAYSVYFTKEEFDSYIHTINQKLVGIGVVIQEHEKGIIVIDVIEGGPAAKSGIEPGDILTHVNDVSLVGVSVQTAISYISGDEGTVVKLTILKPSDALQTVTVTREVVTVPNVSEDLLYGNVGYIRLASFSEDAGDRVSQAITSLKGKGASSFIFDLRNNGGGFVSSAEDIIGLFPQSPNAYKLFYKTSQELGTSTSQPTKFGQGTKVLINRQSASASEMTAAAVKDQSSGTLYGQTTYGKGSMQSFLRISNGDYLKLTVAEFTGPNGLLVNRYGIKPDVETIAGQELEVAHLDEIEKKISRYKKVKSLNDVPLNKTFTITFSQEMSNLAAEQAIELVELGGNSIAITVTRLTSSKFTVTSNELLTSNTSYALMIHPKLHNQNGVIMKQGTYLEVTTTK